MRERFPLTSDQLELLLAFEANPSLKALSERLGRDPSVISRSLQRLAEDLPVLVKRGGRWQITSLGRQVNERSRAFLAELDEIADSREKPRAKKALEPYCSSRAVLLVINAQQALADPSLRNRNNAQAESNILQLLERWRRDGKPVIHVPHLSQDKRSAFHRKASGSRFIPALAPIQGERVVEKSKANAFSSTELESLLKELGATVVVLTGFTAAECIDVTARSASDLGFATFVVGDATATRDIVGADGKVHKADRVHRVVLASLHQHLSAVLDTAVLLRDLARKC